MSQMRLCNAKHIFNIPVWYNSSIKIGGKHVFIETLYLNGVTILETFLMKMELYCQDNLLWKGSIFLIYPQCNIKVL